MTGSTQESMGGLRITESVFPSPRLSLVCLISQHEKNSDYFGLCKDCYQDEMAAQVNVKCASRWVRTPGGERTPERKREKSSWGKRKRRRSRADRSGQRQCLQSDNWVLSMKIIWLGTGTAVSSSCRSSRKWAVWCLLRCQISKL